jgi:hypothetical protein
MKTVIKNILARILGHPASSLSGLAVLAFAALITWGAGRERLALDNTLLLGVWGVGVSLLLAKDPKSNGNA